MNTIKSSLLYAGLEKAEFHRLMPQARAENQGKLKTYALVSFTLFLILTIANLIVRVFPDSAIISYAIMAAFSIGIYVLARMLPAQKPSSTTGLCYIFVGALYVFSLINSSMHPEMPAVAAIAIMLMGPFLFTERPLNLICMNLVTILLLCILSLRLKSRQLALIDLWDALAFGFISIAAEITAENLRFRLLAQADRIRYISETDMMTGCKNRNCYQDRLPRFADMCKKHLVCVYIDVNGLHNLNDSQGHEAGDKMLKSVAQALLDTFDPESTYRIGGDEFVVARPDASPDETRQRMAEVAAGLSAQGYDISTGIEVGQKATLDMEALVKQAEVGMYQEKEAYYQQEGHDRRRR
ncbi:MAG: diguanylate cyclase [Prevotella sp.]|nr:diguanylate cyclase [Prevotella sp.]